MIAGLPLMILLAGVLLELALGRVLSRVAKGWLAFACGLIALGGTLALLPAIASGHAVDLILVSQALRYHVDGLSLVFMLMATGIGTAILLYCIRYMAHEPEGVTRFYALMLTFIAGLVNLVCSANLLAVYVSWEIIGLCSYFLVGFWYKQAAAANGARKVLVMTHLAGYGLLAGILLLYVRTGSLVWTDPAIAGAFTTGIFLLMLVAAMAKSVMFPLHTWIPEAMNAPTPVSALLHSACYVKAGVYLIARMYSLGHWAAGWHTVVLVLGCATMLVGALFALVQTDLKRLLAYSTISQLGYIICGLGLGTDLGIAAGLFYCLSHGLFKGTLFLCSGAVQHAAGTRDLRQLGGLAARMPRIALIWIIAAASIVGVPLTNGFVAKWLLLDAGLAAGVSGNVMPIMVVIVAWLVSTVTAFYMLKATVSVFFGDAPAALQAQEIKEAAPSMQVGMGVLAALCLLFGIAPQLLTTWVVAPAARALGFSAAVTVSWLGVRTSSAGAPTTLGALVLLAALLVGYVLYRMARPPRGEPVHVFTGGDPLPVGDAVGAVDFAEMAETGLAPLYRAADPDPLYLAAWRGVQRGAEWLSRGLAGIEPRPFLAALVLAAVVAIAVVLQ